MTEQDHEARIQYMELRESEGEMTEQDMEERYAGYIYIPQGSLWIAEPTYWRETPAAVWQEAVRTLDNLMPLAESINEAMTIAVGDAWERSRVELERAKEREASERNEHGLSPDEDRRLLHLIDRCDELSNAETMIEDHVPESIGARASTLAALRKLREEAHDELNHYRRELALK